MQIKNILGTDTKYLLGVGDELLSLCKNFTQDMYYNEILKIYEEMRGVSPFLDEASQVLGALSPRREVLHTYTSHTKLQV